MFITTTAARRIAATVLGVAIASVPVAVATAHADAASRPSKADRHAMVEANKVCTDVPGESQYEPCVVGAFIVARHRYIDDRYFVADYSDSAPGVSCTCVTLTRASTKIR